LKNRDVEFLFALTATGVHVIGDQVKSDIWLTYVPGKMNLRSSVVTERVSTPAHGINSDTELRDCRDECLPDCGRIDARQAMLPDPCSA